MPYSCLVWKILYTISMTFDVRIYSAIYSVLRNIYNHHNNNSNKVYIRFLFYII